MYGNFEYGSIPYGDTVTSIIIVIDKKSIKITFISDKKVFEFISERKQKMFISEKKQQDLATAQSRFNDFVSERKQKMFISEKKQQTFISERKTNIFKSSDLK